MLPTATKKEPASTIPHKYPVKITGTKRISTTSFSTTNEEFKIKKNLKYCQLLPSMVTINDALEADNYETVDVTGKIMK